MAAVLIAFGQIEGIWIMPRPSDTLDLRPLTQM